MKKNSVLKIVIVVIAVIACIGFISLFFNKVSDFSIRSVNEDNIICADDYTIKDVKDGDIKVTVDKYGRIDFEGENKSEAAVSYEIGEVVLQKGEYFISSGANGCDKTKYYLVLENSDGEEIIADNHFVVEGTSVYTVSVVVEAGEKINAKFSPVLVNGDEAGKFFVYFK